MNAGRVDKMRCFQASLPAPSLPQFSLSKQNKERRSGCGQEACIQKRIGVISRCRCTSPSSIAGGFGAIHISQGRVSGRRIASRSIAFRGSFDGGSRHVRIGKGASVINRFFVCGVPLDAVLFDGVNNLRIRRCVLRKTCIRYCVSSVC